MLFDSTALNNREFLNSTFICFKWLSIGLFLQYVFSYKCGVVHNSWIKYFVWISFKSSTAEWLINIIHELFIHQLPFSLWRTYGVSNRTYCMSFPPSIFITKCLEDTRYCFIYFIWIICQRLSSCVLKASIYSIN